jgi:hypothetical protein
VEPWIEVSNFRSQECGFMVFFLYGEKRALRSRLVKTLIPISPIRRQSGR